MRTLQLTLAILILLLSASCGAAPSAPSAQGGGQEDPPPAARQEPPQSSSSSGASSDCPGVPAEIGLIDDAEQPGEYQGWCSFSTGMDYASAVDFYRSRLEQGGWEKFRLTEESDGSQTHFYYQKGAAKIAIGVLNSGASYPVIVTIFPEHWIDQACDSGDSGLPTPGDIPLMGDMIGLCQEEYTWGEQPGQEAYQFNYHTLEDYPQAVEFYRTETVKRGWQLTSEYGGDGLIELDFSMPGRTGAIQTSLGNYSQGPLDTMRITILDEKETGDSYVKIEVRAGR